MNKNDILILRGNSNFFSIQQAVHQNRYLLWTGNNRLAVENFGVTRILSLQAFTFNCATLIVVRLMVKMP